MIMGLKESIEELSNKDLLDKTILVARIADMNNESDRELYILHYNILTKRLLAWLELTKHLDLPKNEEEEDDELHT